MYFIPTECLYTYILHLKIDSLHFHSYDEFVWSHAEYRLYYCRKVAGRFWYHLVVFWKCSHQCCNLTNKALHCLVFHHRSQIEKMNRKSVRLCAFQLHIHSAHITFGILLKAIVCLSNKSHVHTISCRLYVNDSMNIHVKNNKNHHYHQQQQHIERHILIERFQLNAKPIDMLTQSNRTQWPTLRPRIQSSSDSMSCSFTLHSSTMNIHIFD